MFFIFLYFLICSTYTTLFSHFHRIYLFQIIFSFCLNIYICLNLLCSRDVSSNQSFTFSEFHVMIYFFISFLVINCWMNNYIVSEDPAIIYVSQDIYISIFSTYVFCSILQYYDLDIFNNSWGIKVMSLYEESYCSSFSYIF